MKALALLIHHDMCNTSYMRRFPIIIFHNTSTLLYRYLNEGLSETYRKQYYCDYHLNYLFIAKTSFSYKLRVKKHILLTLKK